MLKWLTGKPVAPDPGRPRVSIHPDALARYRGTPEDLAQGIVFLEAATPPRVGTTVVLDLVHEAGTSEAIETLVIWARPTRGVVHGGCGAKVTRAPAALEKIFSRAAGVLEQRREFAGLNRVSLDSAVTEMGRARPPEPSFPPPARPLTQPPRTSAPPPARTPPPPPRIEDDGLPDIDALLASISKPPPPASRPAPPTPPPAPPVRAPPPPPAPRAPERPPARPRVDEAAFWAGVPDVGEDLFGDFAVASPAPPAAVESPPRAPSLPPRARTPVPESLPSLPPLAFPPPKPPIREAERIALPARSPIRPQTQPNPSVTRTQPSLPRFETPPDARTSVTMGRKSSKELDAMLFEDVDVSDDVPPAPPEYAALDELLDHDELAWAPPGSREEIVEDFSDLDDRSTLPEPEPPDLRADPALRAPERTPLASEDLFGSGVDDIERAFTPTVSAPELSPSRLRVRFLDVELFLAYFERHLTAGKLHIPTDRAPAVGALVQVVLELPDGRGRIELPATITPSPPGTRGACHAQIIDPGGVFSERIAVIVEALRGA